MDPLEVVFLFCFVFGLAMTGLSFLLSSLHLPACGHHASGHELGGHDVDYGHAGSDHGHGQIAHAPGGGSLHEGHGGHAEHGGPGQRGESGPSPFNVNTGTAFLAFFGGVGHVLYGTLGVAAAISLILATLAGLAGGAAVFFFLVKVLLKGQRYLNPADFRMEGTLAKVTLPIRPDGIGEIVYSRDGTRRSEGARSANGEAIVSETEVVIVRYERGIAFVEPWESYAREG